MGKSSQELFDLRRFVLNRDGFCCVLCGSSDALTIHHIRPKSLRGRNVERNLITLCSNCHDELHTLGSVVSGVVIWFFGRLAFWRARRRR